MAKANGTTARESDPMIDQVRREVVLTGVTPIMFDRYPGDNSTRLEWHQKVYLRPNTSRITLPAMNIVSFLSSHNTNSARASAIPRLRAADTPPCGTAT